MGGSGSGPRERFNSSNREDVQPETQVSCLVYRLKYFFYNSPFEDIMQSHTLSNSCANANVVFLYISQGKNEFLFLMKLCTYLKKIRFDLMV